MYAIKRKVFTRDEALEKRIVKYEFENEPDRDPFAAVNNYPCNTGIIINE